MVVHNMLNMSTYQKKSGVLSQMQHLIHVNRTLLLSPPSSVCLGGWENSTCAQGQNNLAKTIWPRPIPVCIQAKSGEVWLQRESVSIVIWLNYSTQTCYMFWVMGSIIFWRRKLLNQAKRQSFRTAECSLFWISGLTNSITEGSLHFWLIH